MKFMKFLVSTLVTTVSGWLVIVCTIVFLLEINSGASFIEPLLFDHSTWYTYLTPSLMHLSWLHLILNLFTLFCVGLYMEYTIGKFQYILFLMIASIISNAGQGFIVGTGFAGISGVVFAVCAYVMVEYHFKEYYKIKHDNPWRLHATVQIIGLLVLGFLFNYYATDSIGFGLANVAHLYGFLVGAIWSMISLNKQYPLSGLRSQNNQNKRL